MTGICITTASTYVELEFNDESVNFDNAVRRTLVASQMDITLKSDRVIVNHKADSLVLDVDGLNGASTDLINGIALVDNTDLYTKLKEAKG
jgi:hypothetical protein